jgi:hypothetical protein
MALITRDRDGPHLPFSPKDATWRSAHRKMIVSIADVPWQRSGNREVGMATADGCEIDAA